MILIVFGVAGSGKTTIAKALSKALKIAFYDADDFHPQKNINKMQRGIPLSDDDRFPWLKILSSKIRQWNKESDFVLACSALKENYREILSKNNKKINWIFLDGSYNLIKSRLNQRKSHFMKSDMLKSQFDALEKANYAIDIAIDKNPDKIIETILKQIKPFIKADIGIVGLGVMGKNLSLNLLQKGFAVSVYNRSDYGESRLVAEFLEANKQYHKLKGFTDLKAFVNSLKSPHNIFMMITSGKPIDDFISSITPLLKPNDCLMDGGNSFFEDTNLRAALLSGKQIYYLGIGVSGGESGALNGPSLMVGGSKKAYNVVAFILEKMAAKDIDNLPCCAYLGKGGAGHFVKMVHNGIEYAEMQLLAELYAILNLYYKKKDIAVILKDWEKTDLNSFLLKITKKISITKSNDDFLLDMILDKVASRGTGNWTLQTALKLGLPNNMIHEAVMARYISTLKNKRNILSALLNLKSNSQPKLDLNMLANAYRFARIINLHQGFYLLKGASKHFNWNYKLSTIARIWTEGCIIKSELMQQASVQLKKQNSILENPYFFEKLKKYEKDISIILKQAIDLRLAFPVFNAAYQYWISITTIQSSANLIQAQRDFFGAHTFQRIDKPETEYFHFNWHQND